MSQIRLTLPEVNRMTASQMYTESTYESKQRKKLSDAKDAIRCHFAHRTKHMTSAKLPMLTELGSLGFTQLWRA